jgi:opacity protein-like surface antigen
MKKFIVLIVVILFSVMSYSQNRISVGLGYDVAFPMGDLADVVKIGHSWTLFGEYPINPKYSVQLITGYTIYAANTGEIGYQGKVITFDLKSIPIKGAVKYFIYDEFYLIGELGVNLIKVTANFQDAYGGTTTESTDFQAKLAMGAGIGTSFKLSEQSLINISSKYFSHILLGASLVVHFDI